MSCPMGFDHDLPKKNGTLKGTTHTEGVDTNGKAPNRVVLNEDDESDVLTYHKYLQLGKILTAQSLLSTKDGLTVPDEHLFIIIHQAYELWFKQIIYDIDQVRNLFNNKIVDETKMLQIVSLLERTVKILKLLVDQMLILETMSPIDFIEFRKYLVTSSGFQSLQFRLLENKLGVINDNRVKYNMQNYADAFKHQFEVDALEDSESSPSLFNLVEGWLARTPGIHGVPSKESNAEEAFSNLMDERLNLTDRQVAPKETGFWENYLIAVDCFLADVKKKSEQPDLTEEERSNMRKEYDKTKFSFESITNPNEYNKFVKKQERRFSHEALKGGLMIYFYRHMPRFSQPYQILTFLMDIDCLLQKWRYNHVMLVQRMLGSKMGTGGSSGYHYLKTTVSDRYKVFLDIFNLSTWLLPRVYMPPPSPRLERTLSHHTSFS